MTGSLDSATPDPRVAPFREAVMQDAGKPAMLPPRPAAPASSRGNAMHACIRHRSNGRRSIGLALAILLVAGIAPGVVFAQQNVDCKLPGEVRSVGGHSMMSAGRIVQTTPDDCRQRGGEYTVPETAPVAPAAASPAAAADDGAMVSCLLPAQTRQLGEKTRYRTTRHTIHTTRSDCQTRGGTVYVAHKGHSTHKKS